MGDALILVAAGASQRFGSHKLTTLIDGDTVLRLALAGCAHAQRFEQTVVVATADLHAEVTSAAAGLDLGHLSVVTGGSSRQSSVRAGLACVEGDGIVCVHDAARPLCPADVFTRVMDAGRGAGAATAVLPMVDSIKRVDDSGRVLASIERSGLVRVQTPQAFWLSVLRRAHAEALGAGIYADDDCALVERVGVRVMTVAGDPRALKLTTPDDLGLLRALRATAG